MDANRNTSTDSTVKPHTPEEQQKELDLGINAIKKGSLTALSWLRRGYILSLACANNVMPHISVNANPLGHLHKRDQMVVKADYARALIDWVHRTMQIIYWLLTSMLVQSR